MSRSSRALDPLLFACAALALGSPHAYASPSYGELVAQTFAMPCEPTCLLCHTRESGGYATANTKLGITLRRDPYDMLCCEDDKLEAILAALESNATDSDHDGTSDAAEMRAFRNPNVPDSTATPIPLTCEPKHDDGGCSLTQRGTADPAPYALALWAFFFWRRRAAAAR